MMATMISGKIGSVTHLTRLKEELAAKKSKETRDTLCRIHVCMGGGCMASGSQNLRGALEAEIRSRTSRARCPSFPRAASAPARPARSSS